MTEKDKNYFLREILDRLKQIERVNNDTDLCTPLKVTKLNIASYKSRGSIPWEKLLEYGRRKKISMEYILNGRGPVENDRFGVAEPDAVYTVETNQDAVYDIAAQVYAELQAQGKTAGQDKYRQLIKLLHRNMLETGQPPGDGKIKELIMLI